MRHSAGSAGGTRRVELLYDFVSIYSWLALARAADFAAAHDVEWQPRPVLFAKLLDASGRVAAGEIKASRDVALTDAFYRATELGLEFRPPPVHPFNSLHALRVAGWFQDDAARCLRVSRVMFAAGFERGEDLSDLAVLEATLARAGEEPAVVRRALGDPATKARLRANTAAATAREVFGVPTFVLPSGQLIYGQDRMADVAAALERRLPSASPALRDAQAAPVAPGRRRS